MNSLYLSLTNYLLSLNSVYECVCVCVLVWPYACAFARACVCDCVFVHVLSVTTYIIVIDFYIVS